MASDGVNQFTTSGTYELLDFGRQRKLESLGGYVVDRPSPAAESFTPVNAAVWKHADAKFDVTERKWLFRNPWPKSLVIDCGDFVMPTVPTPYGHIGIFPEQSDNWRWLMAGTAYLGDDALNLFAYTGAATMALVKAGYTVSHVDAAKPNVAAASQVARLNGWDQPRIRFLVDDAAKFAARERRRGRRYHTIVLDPPAYGHSPGGHSWRIQRDLWPLLDDLVELLTPNRFRLLVTGHSPQVDHGDVVNYLANHPRLHSTFPRLHIHAGRSQLRDQAARSLDTGFVVRVERAAIP